MGITVARSGVLSFKGGGVYGFWGLRFSGFGVFGFRVLGYRALVFGVGGLRGFGFEVKVRLGSRVVCFVRLQVLGFKGFGLWLGAGMCVGK